ncbi:MAG: zinc ribbon domain-containing protein [Terriglobales bacterium]
MHKNLEVLLDIQALEQRARELEQEIAALPRRKAAIEAKLAGAKAALERTQAAQAGNQSERRQLDRDIDSLREKISKIRGHSGDVKTNQEYKALLDEIAYAEKQISEHEEHLLQVMEQADGLERQTAEAKQTLAGEQRAVELETAACAERAQRDHAELAELQKRRGGLRAEAEELWLRRFDKVVKMRAQALAAVDREACSGCRVRLRPQFLQEMMAAPERLFVCESCGRILYMETTVASC